MRGALSPLALSLALWLAGCEPARHLSVVTGPVGGTMYAVSAAWAEIVNQTVPGVQVTNQVAGGSAYTARVLGNGEADFAFSANDATYDAYRGENLFEDNPHPELRAIAALYPESFHAVVRAESGLSRIEDLVGRTTAVGPPGSGTLLNSRKVLEAYGLSMDDVGATELGFLESAEYLRDGHCDAAFYMPGIPYPPVVDISVTQEVDVFGLSDEVVERLVDRYPYLVETTVPPGVYDGVGHPFRTVSVKMLLITTDAMDAETVYLVTRALFEHLDRLKASHASAKEIALEGALEGVPIPLHEGAERYYRERGLDLR